MNCPSCTMPMQEREQEQDFFCKACKTMVSKKTAVALDKRKQQPVAATGEKPCITGM